MKQHKRIRATEEEILTALGGRRTPFSGSGWVKGDGRVPKPVPGRTAAPGGGGGYRVESKTTVSAFYRLRPADWLDISVSSRSAHEEPIFHIRLRATDAIMSKDLAVVRLETAERLGARIPTRTPAEDKTRRKSWRVDTQTRLPVVFRLEMPMVLGTPPRAEILVAVDFGTLQGWLDEERRLAT
jgi:hypothetical protein